MLVYQAERKADPHHPRNPTFIDRRFNLNREIPEAQVAKMVMLEDVAEATTLYDQVWTRLKAGQ